VGAPKTRLRDLIRAVRACKTQQAERDVVARESADLRHAFRSEQGGTVRFSAIVKLVFLHLLGYPTHFGQMECVTLCSSNSYAHKRIGYLGLMVLLDESHELLMMATNSMKSDLRSKNQYIAALALCTLGNISSDSMGRDLAPEVQRLLREPNPYIRKKAAACSLRIVRRVPELADGFLEDALLLLRDRHHGVLIAAVALAHELCLHSENALCSYKKQVHQLVRLLNSLSSAAGSVEHDVSGVVDPFLQVRILQLLGVLGRGDSDTSDSMGDTLATVASPRDLHRNAGLSVAYQCVQTIMEIESFGSQRVHAINLLGRFLSHRDNNIRYVALETLANVVGVDSQAVQRHRNTIVECMKDVDPSIRRRALDLLGCLANEESVRSLVEELLDHFNSAEHSDNDFAAELAKRASKLVTGYSPDKQWQVDTMLKLIEIAGHHLRNVEVSDAVRLVSNTDWLHGYAARACHRALSHERDRLNQNRLSSDTANAALIEVASWAVGEFGDMIVTGDSQLDVANDDLFANHATRESDVVDVLQSLASMDDLDEVARQYVLIALMKLAIRFPNLGDKIYESIQESTASSSLDLQQRAIEFKRLYRLHSNLQKSVLERMPSVGVSSHEYAGTEPHGRQQQQQQQTRDSTVDELLRLSEEPAASGTSSGIGSFPGSKDAASLLGDLMLDNSETATSNGSLTRPPQEEKQETNSSGSALADLLGGEGESEQHQHQNQQDQQNGEKKDPKKLLQEMSSPQPQAHPPSAVGAPPQPHQVALQDQNGLSVSFASSEGDDNGQRLVNVVATYMNASQGSDITGMVVQWAAPKDASLELRQATGNFLGCNRASAVTQSMRVRLPHGKSLSMLARVGYTIAATGQRVQYQSKLQVTQ